jgi:hypothetical protein
MVATPKGSKEKIMEKIVIFSDSAETVERETNAWLAENSEKIEIVSRHITGCVGPGNYVISLAIFYKEK